MTFTRRFIRNLTKLFSYTLGAGALLALGALAVSVSCRSRPGILGSATLLFVIMVSGGASLIWLRRIGGKAMEELNGLDQLSKRLAGELHRVAELQAEIERTLGAEELAASEAENVLLELGDLIAKGESSAVQGLEHTIGLSSKGAQEASEAIENFKMAVSRTSMARSELAAMNQMMLQIEDKTRLIDNIVFKTNILSFNASIEAARAAQVGRGFAVVADEIGKLARQTREASQEIATLVEQTERQVEGVVMTAAAAGLAVEKVGGQFSKAFQHIVEGLDQSAPLIRKIADNAQDQRRVWERAETSLIRKKMRHEREKKLAELRESYGRLESELKRSRVAS